MEELVCGPAPTEACLGLAPVQGSGCGSPGTLWGGQGTLAAGGGLESSFARWSGARGTGPGVVTLRCCGQAQGCCRAQGTASTSGAVTSLSLSPVDLRMLWMAWSFEILSMGPKLLF